jgi:hypothetical protein
MVGGDMFGTPGQWLGVAIFIAFLGAGMIKGCEYGCGYVGSKVETKWK